MTFWTLCVPPLRHFYAFLRWKDILEPFYILQCVFQFIFVAEAYLDTLAVIDQDFLNQVNDALSVQFRQMLVLFELLDPLNIPGAVFQSLTAFVLQLSQLPLPVRNPAVIACMEFSVLLPADNTVCHIRIQVDFQILISLDFIFQCRQLCIIVNVAEICFRIRAVYG